MEKRIEAKGNIIETLEGERFRILELVSESRMSVVYRAERLIEDGKKHNVLLKAFVISEKFEYSLDVYQEYVRHELEINQKLNAIGFTGALTISYVVRGKKDGIVYGVILNIQSGMTLQKYATTANFRYVTLRDRIDIIKKLAVILDEFHKECRMIHGDISPDNIYLQESGMGRNGESSLTVVLLDFGSVQELDDGGREYLPIYAKTDYVHPDIIKGKRNILEKDDDWYGLLCCLWFSFTGRTVIEYAPVEENIYEVYQRIAVSYEQNLFDYAEDSIIQKQIQNYQVIYKKIVELFDTGMKRTDLIIKNLQKILSLIDDNGISTERLFGNLKTEYEQLRESRFSSLHILKDILPYVEFHLPQSTPRFIKTRNKQSQTLHQIMEENQDSLFMIGDGGMGKTTSLIGIMDYEYGELKNSNSPVIFIELSVLSQNCEDWYQEKRGGTFIEQFIASYLTGTPRKFVEKTHPYILPIHDELFRLPEDGKKKYTVLLDGMNEIGFINEKSRAVFYDALNQYLRYARNLRLIITGRNDVYELSSEYLSRLKALGLTDDSIINVLKEAVKERKISGEDFQNLLRKRTDISTNESRLWNCLKIPFFLMMYCVSSNKKNVESQGEILRNFFHDKREILSADTVYGEQSQAQIRYQFKKYDDNTDLSMEYALKAVLDFIIPEIAITMIEKSYFFITEDMMYSVVNQYFERLKNLKRQQVWTRVYYGYQDDIRAIFEEIERIDGGKRIPEYACGVLGIMRATANGTYFFTHQYFRDYFAARALINKILGIIELRSHEREKWNSDSERFSEFVYPFQAQEMPDYVCALVGEILGERKNIPVFKRIKKVWAERREIIPEQKVLTDFMECYRNVRRNTNETQMGLRNLISILKKSRIRNDGNIDFSGIDFSGINLDHMSLRGVIFSHFSRDGGIYSANLSGTKHVLDAIRSDDKQQIAVCCGVHLTKRKILILNENLHSLLELDLESGERTTLLSVDPGYISAFYVGDDDNILIVRTEQEKIEDDESYAEYDSDKFYNKTIVELQYYFRKNNKSVYYQIKNVLECLEVIYSEKDKQLSLFIKADEGIVLVLLELLEYFDSDIEQPVRKIGNYVLPLEMEYWSKIERNTFMVTRLNEEEYIFSDCKIFKWNIGKWNIREGKIQSVCYLEEISKNEEFYAVCSDVSHKNIIFLKGDEKLYVTGLKEVHNIGKNREWSINAQSGERVYNLRDHNILLILSNGVLTAYDTEEKKLIWRCASLVIAQLFVGHGVVINSDNGIYEIDIVDGGYRCLQQFQKDRIQCIVGRTSEKNSILLYESTGIVKWIDIEMGCCYRYVSVQNFGQTLDSIFCYEDKDILYGISGTKIYSWDGWSGTIKRIIDLSFSEEWIPYFIDFNAKEKKIDVYFERKDYEKFPLKKKYFLMEWSLYLERWEYSYREEMEKEELYRYVYSDYGDRLVKECINVENCQNEQNGYTQTNVRKRIMNFFSLVDENDTNDDLLREYDDVESEKILWNTKYNVGREKQKDIYYKNRNKSDKWKYVDSVNGNKQVIGVTETGILYALNQDVGEADMKLYRPGREELIKIGGMEQQNFMDAFVVGNIFVGLVPDETGIYGDKIYFWNTEKNFLYDYEISEKVYVAGCKVDEEEIEKRNEKLAHMEGMSKPARHIFRKVERFENKIKFRSVETRQLLKQWNYPALICVIILLALDVFLRFLTRNSLQYSNREFVYLLQNCLLMGVLYCMVIFILKAGYPHLICIMQQESIYSNKVNIFIKVLMLLFFNFLLFFYTNLLHMNTSIRIFLIIPFVWAYFYCCPIKKGKALAVGVAYIGVLIVLILIEVPQSIILKMEIIIFVIFSNVYILQQCRLHIEGKKRFRKTLLCICFVVLFAIVIAWKKMNSGENLWGADRLYNLIFYWSQYFEHIRATIFSYNFWGAMNTLEEAYSEVDFYQNFTLSYVMEHYGILCGIIIMSVIGFMLYFLWKGAKDQTILIDKCACVSCTIYMITETIVAVLPALGIGVLPPCRLPFWGGRISDQRTTWMALGIYMAFYQAHRRCRK